MTENSMKSLADDAAEMYTYMRKLEELSTKMVEKSSIILQQLDNGKLTNEFDYTIQDTHMHIENEIANIAQRVRISNLIMEDILNEFNPELLDNLEELASINDDLSGYNKHVPIPKFLQENGIEPIY